MLDHTVVGQQIAFLRKQNHLTQEELAEKLGITAQAISKWENGHSLPETALLPSLAKHLQCSIDSILMMFAMRDAEFLDFVHTACGQHGELAMQIYQRMEDKFHFTVAYDEKFFIFDSAHDGCSARFNIQDKKDFIIRIDVEVGGEAEEPHLAVRIPLVHCSEYMYLVDDMPEHIKRNFRVSDCKSCTCSCPYCMTYAFEGVEYKQCHFITISLTSEENMEHLWTFVCAEHEAYLSGKAR